MLSFGVDLACTTCSTACYLYDISVCF